MKQRRTTAEATAGSIVAPRVRRHRRPDGGYSLIEVVISVALSGVVVAPLMLGVVTAVRSSAMRNHDAVLETVMTNAADRVNRAPKQCDYSSFVRAAVLERGWAASTVSVQQFHFVPGTSATQAGTWSTGGCVGTSPTGAVQMVRMTITSPNSSTKRTLEVVKSDV
jgi:type II secretory pathway pseudopilin PulG